MDLEFLVRHRILLRLTRLVGESSRSRLDPLNLIVLERLSQESSHFTLQKQLKTAPLLGANHVDRSLPIDVLHQRVRSQEQQRLAGIPVV